MKSASSCAASSAVAASAEWERRKRRPVALVVDPLEPPDAEQNQCGRDGPSPHAKACHLVGIEHRLEALTEELVTAGGGQRPEVQIDCCVRLRALRLCLLDVARR